MPLRPILPRLLSAGFLLACACALHAQELLVVDEAGEPVIGATVERLSSGQPATAVEAISGITDDTGVLPLTTIGWAPHDLLRVRYLGYAQAVVRADTLPRDGAGRLQLALAPAQAALAQAVVTAVRARPNDPFAFVTLDARRLADANVGQDIPFLLRRTPGAVFTSDAGNGVGYTGIRIRGADATRINVTINGVPLNDAESQGVYWVNLPDLVSSTSSIQVQRGVGESTYGAGAFGANINLVTRPPSSEAGLTGELAGGSFGTARAMLRASTGELGPELSAEARVSYLRSEGFVDRAASRLGSAFVSAAFAPNDRQRLQLVATHGRERTYQSWYGIPESYVDDPDLRTYNPAGLRADGTFYDDQVDDYRQTHLQLLYSAGLATDWLLQLTGHYTHGKGFYEEWRVGDRIGDYLPDSPAADATTDLARRLWLDNDFAGGLATVSGRLSPKLDLTASAGYSYYYGDHFTALPYVAADVVGQADPERVFGNDATKTDANAFAKLNYRFTDRLRAYTDLQVRHVDYRLEATRANEREPRRGLYTFVNPKLGLVADLPGWSAGSRATPANAFVSAAVGQREPNRNDFVDAPQGVVPASEMLYDLELGLRSPRGTRYTFAATTYLMVYRDQLALTGALNEVGEAIRVNIPRSHRVGVELAAAAPLGGATGSSLPGGRWSLEGNLALSDSRVDRFEERVDNFGTGGQDIIVRESTPLAFSPQAVANLGLVYQRVTSRDQRLEAALWGNWVSRQFLDNSGSRAASLAPYGRVDLELRYTPAYREGAVLFTVQVQNLTGVHAPPNGYVYRYISPGYDPRPDDPYTIRERGDTYLYQGVYPQAGLQVLAGARLRLGRGA